MPPKIDPITAEKRSKANRNGGYVHSVEEKQAKGELNLVKRPANLTHELDIIHLKYKGRTKADIVLRQGLHVNELTAALTDAYLDATYEGIKKFESLSIPERNKIWTETYSKLFERIIAPHIKGHRDAIEAAQEIETFLSLPKSLFNARERKGKKGTITKRAKRKMKKYSENPIQNFLAAVERVLKRTETGLTLSGKAMRVCIAASVYADLMHERGKPWIASYRTAMRYAYIKLRRKPEIIEAIAKLK